jgi:hypothetical protein
MFFFKSDLDNKIEYQRISTTGSFKQTAKDHKGFPLAVDGDKYLWTQNKLKVTTTLLNRTMEDPFKLKTS